MQTSYYTHFRAQAKTWELKILLFWLQTESIQDVWPTPLPVPETLLFILRSRLIPSSETAASWFSARLRLSGVFSIWLQKSRKGSLHLSLCCFTSSAPERAALLILALFWNSVPPFFAQTFRFTLTELWKDFWFFSEDVGPSITSQVWRWHSVCQTPEIWAVIDEINKGSNRDCVISVHRRNTGALMETQTLHTMSLRLKSACFSVRRHKREEDFFILFSIEMWSMTLWPSGLTFCAEAFFLPLLKPLLQLYSPINTSDSVL